MYAPPWTSKRTQEEKEKEVKADIPDYEEILRQERIKGICFKQPFIEETEEEWDKDWEDA